MPLLFALAAIAAAASPPVQPNGAALYQAHCAACHAAGPRHPGTQSLAIKYKGQEPAALTERTDLAPDVVTYFVRNGVASMPPFRKTEISDAEVAAIAAFLAHPSH